MTRAWLAGLAWAACGAVAQAQGGTDIWIAELSGTGATLSLAAPRNLTARPGYDNQPQFTPDGQALLYTRIEASGRSDVWRVALGGGAPVRVTDTAVEQEYSPTPMPDGRGFSAIVVEADSTQRLWAYGWDGRPQRIIVPALKPVGYHVWVGGERLGAFVLSQPTPDVPNALVVMQPASGRVDTLARGIERAFARVPGREAFTFVQRRDSATMVLEADVRTLRVRPVMTGPAGLEYHVWLPDGSMLISGNGRIWRWADGQLTSLADLRALGIEGVTRLALGPDGKTLAFVAADPRR